MLSLVTVASVALTDVDPGLGGEHNGSHIASRSGLTHPVKREGASVNIFSFRFEMPCASDCQTVRSAAWRSKRLADTLWRSCLWTDVGYCDNPSLVRIQD